MSIHTRYSISFHLVPYGASRQTARPLGAVIFCMAGSSPMRCVCAAYYNGVFTRIRIAKPFPFLPRCFTQPTCRLRLRRQIHSHLCKLKSMDMFTASASANNQNIFISCILRLLRAAVHSQSFRLRQQHIIFKNRVDIWLYILCVAP